MLVSAMSVDISIVKFARLSEVLLISPLFSVVVSVFVLVTDVLMLSVVSEKLNEFNIRMKEISNHTIIIVILYKYMM